MTNFIVAATIKFDRRSDEIFGNLQFYIRKENVNVNVAS